jgi:hypothetical protein
VRVQGRPERKAFGGRIPREPNLFVYFHDRLCRRDDDQNGAVPDRPGGWENALTEATAFYLSCDREALVKVVQRIAGPGDPPMRIGTQVREIDGTPDLAIERKSGKRLIIECKVDADLGDRQLERYVRILSPNGGHLALLSRRRQIVPHEVERCKLYKKHPDRSHFFWQDLHSWIRDLGAGSSRPLRSHFLRYLERLGFEEMRSDVKMLLGSRKEELNRRHQQSFGRKMARTFEWFNGQGFTASMVSHKGIQAVPPTGASYRHIVVWPATSRRAYVTNDLARLIPGANFVVGYVFDRPSQGDAEDFYRLLPTTIKDSDGRHWVKVPPRRIAGGRLRVELVSSLNEFLRAPAAIDEALQNAVALVVRSVKKVTGVKSRPGRHAGAGRLELVP